MIRRVLVLTVLLLVVWGLRVSLRAPLVAPDPGPIATFPARIDEWSGTDLYMDPLIAKATGADAILNRLYRSRSQRAISVYVGYYRSQREGDQVHSPLNCLPGAGWQPLTIERVTISGDHGASTINKVIVDKSGERQLVLYWYQSFARITASEYWSKAYMVSDAFRSRRSDVALVRLVSPIDEMSEQAVLLPAMRFAESVLPLVSRQLFQ